MRVKTAGLALVAAAVAGCGGFHQPLAADCSWVVSDGYDVSDGQAAVDEGDGYVSLVSGRYTDTGYARATTQFLQCGSGVGVSTTRNIGLSFDENGNVAEPEPDEAPALLAEFREIVDAWRDTGHADVDALYAALAPLEARESVNPVRASDDDPVATCACARFYRPTAPRWAEGDA